MRYLNDYADSRSLLGCVFCGAETSTRDHCPSKIFLDTPYPDNLPVVSACLDCNRGFSLDEEYLACFIECVKSGSADLENLARLKVRRILRAKPALQGRIQGSLRIEGGARVFYPEIERAKNVICKLAVGHVAYEMSESVEVSLADVSIFPLISLTLDQRAEFEASWFPEIWPEVGSRALSRLVSGEGLDDFGWVVVQPGSYRYSVSWSGDVQVKIVIAEYLGCIARWP